MRTLLATSLAVLGMTAGAVSVAAADSVLPSAELVTVTDEGFAATWRTEQAADTTVCVGRPGSAQRCETQDRDRRLHHAEIRGLKAGTRYAYTLRSAGAAQPVSTFNPGSFTTLRAPPGRHLFDVALLSDIHLGEKCSGTGATVSGQSVPPCFSAPDYARRMSEAAVAEINARGIGLTVVNADNTSQGEYDQARAAREVLDGLDGGYAIARGSHDRPGQNPFDPRCGTDNDCFRSVFFPDRSPGRIFYSVNRGRLHFVVLDSVDLANGQGDLSDPEQRAFLRADLEKARRQGRRTFILFHHPVSEYATTYAVPPAVFGVRADRGGQDFLRMMADFPNVVGVLNSHTHRNFVSYSPSTGARLPYIENGPAKEYPGGYSVLSVYEGGYMRTFRRLTCDFCREWISATRGEYFGLYPLYTLGTLGARNFTHVYGCDVPTPPPSLLGYEPVESATTRGLCD